MLLGLTQFDLAYLSKVSLPTIQNIEAGRANPSLDKLEKILTALNINISLKINNCDWDRLAELGIPISSKNASKKLNANFDLLLQALKSACMELKLSAKDNTDDADRKRDAVSATLAAIKDHYPSLYNKYIFKSSLLTEFTPGQYTGRIIKSRRLALACLSRYL